MDADVILDRRRLKRRLAVWRTLAILAVVGLAAGLTAELVLPSSEHIARLKVAGLIIEDARRDEMLADLVEDDKARALIVRINSPGGTTAGSEELFQGLRRVSEKKPVIAVIGTIGTSGGYIVAAAANHVLARETSLTGSIGVLLQTAEFTELLAKLGISAEVLKSSPLKGQPSPTEAMTDEARQALGQVLSDSYDWFVELVRERGELSAEEAALVTDGRLFTGRQAVANRLIDGIGGEREARAWLETEREISSELPMVDLDYHERPSVISQFTNSLVGKVLSFEPLILDGLVSVWQPH
jgi:protease-4